jgi:hypothetical protein
MNNQRKNPARCANAPGQQRSGVEVQKLERANSKRGIPCTASNDPCSNFLQDKQAVSGASHTNQIGMCHEPQNTIVVLLTMLLCWLTK